MINCNQKSFVIILSLFLIILSITLINSQGTEPPTPKFDKTAKELVVPNDPIKDPLGLLPEAKVQDLKDAKNTKEFREQIKIPDKLFDDYLDKFSDDAVNNKKLKAEDIINGNDGQTRKERVDMIVKDGSSLWQAMSKSQTYGEETSKIVTKIIKYKDPKIDTVNFLSKDFTNSLWKESGKYFQFNDAIFDLTDTWSNKLDFGTGDLMKSITAKDFTGNIVTWRQGTLQDSLAAMKELPPPYPQGNLYHPEKSGNLGGFGGTGGSGGSGGSDMSSIMESLSKTMGIVQQLIGAIPKQTDVQSNAKGITDISDSGWVTIKDDSKVAIQSKDKKDDNNKDKEVRLSETEKGKGSKTQVDENLNLLAGENTIATIPNVATVITKTGTATTAILNDPSKKDPVPSSLTRNDQLSTVSVWPSVSERITGGVITDLNSPNQYIKFSGQDITASGKKFSVILFKSFNYLNSVGENLLFLNGETYIGFDNGETLYSREIRKTPYFINRIKNDNDERDIFYLLKGGSKGSYLIDGENRVTVGDTIIPHPDSKYSGIYIAKEREEMFSKNYNHGFS